MRLRKTLALSPLDEPATRGLARLLTAAGAVEEAERLCSGLAERTASKARC